MFEQFLSDCREVSEATRYVEIFNYSVSGRRRLSIWPPPPDTEMACAGGSESIAVTDYRAELFIQFM